MPAPQPLPEMHPLKDSRWDTTCGNCQRHCAPIPAVDAASAWRVLKRIGWIAQLAESTGRTYARCRSCTKAEAITFARGEEMSKRDRR
jgi:hypothetical protein